MHFTSYTQVDCPTDQHLQDHKSGQKIPLKWFRNWYFGFSHCPLLALSIISLFRTAPNSRTLYIVKLYYADKSRRRINQGKPAWADRNHDYIIEPGEEIIERYVVRGRIGKGSFGQVLRAFDKVTKTDVALKMIKCKKPFKNQANTEIDILVELQKRKSP